MGGRMDDATGRAKEAIGDLTDRDDLRREGKIDQASGAVKEKLEHAKDRVEDMVDKVKESLKSDE